MALYSKASSTQKKQSRPIKEEQNGRISLNSHFSCDKDMIITQ